MKLKTFKATSKDKIDNLVNEFESNNEVRATQTHINYVEGVWNYHYVLFYNPKLEKQNMNLSLNIGGNK